MPSDPVPGDPVTDPCRLERLHSLSLLDTAAEEGFDRLTRIAKLCLSVPVSLVSLVDGDRQFFKSQMGLPEPYASDRQTPLSHSFCQHVVRTGKPLVVSDARMDPALRANGAVADIGVIAYAGVPLVTPDGLVIGSFAAIDTQPRDWAERDLAILHDLGEAVMVGVQLKQTTAAAEAANRSKDRFLAMLSHELRTPLSPVLLLSAAIAEDESLPESVRADALTISRNVRQQSRLVDDLLDVTRIENGKVSLSSSLVDLNPLLAEVVADSRADASAKRVALTLSICAAAAHHVSGDAGRLRQVFGNLVRNAVKFTPAGGNVAVATAGVPGARVLVTVSDTGIGVAPALLPRLFDPFEQGSRAITDEFSGLGLGLAIAKGLVDAHGGSITAASDGPGRGTTFTVTLPAAAPPVAAAPVAVSFAPTAGVEILLVEDHRDTLAAMSRLLRRLGHRVTGAESMKAARDAASRQRFDLLISDVELPDGTGLDLMRQLSTDLTDRRLRGIALTGYGMESDVKMSEAAGFFAHLVKPINFSDLEDAIRRATV
jgi:signal transduction histidine kinase/CheY-like chemotaxis protein